MNRDMAFRRSDRLHELYGIQKYSELTNAEPARGLRQEATDAVLEIARHQDWALMGPSRIATVKDRHAVFYYNRQGPATYNRWLAGTIGYTRLAEKYGWKREAEFGRYLVAKLAIARVAQARYVAERHRLGLVRGAEADDNRTLLHIDTRCALVGRGPLELVVHQNQEIPPFIDLVEEVGRLLGKYARPECKIYLDHLDYSMPLWYCSEAPKQSATEQRTCPLQHLNGNVLAQYWILDKRGPAFRQYVDTTRFVGDLYYIQNLAAAIASYGE
jgi:hypothetical protein